MLTVTFCLQHLLNVKSLKYLSNLTLHDRITKSLLHLHKKKKPPSISAQFQVSWDGMDGCTRCFTVQQICSLLRKVVFSKSYSDRAETTHTSVHPYICDFFFVSITAYPRDIMCEISGNKKHAWFCILKRKWFIHWHTLMKQHNTLWMNSSNQGGKSVKSFYFVFLLPLSKRFMVLST